MYITNAPPKKSIAFIYICDKWTENEIKKTTPFKLALTNTKYLGITLTRQLKIWNDKIIRFLKKEIKEDLRRWKDFLRSWVSVVGNIKK